MISGAHVIVYSKNADADRAFLRDVLGFKSVDAGGGWLIFALPPAEVALHPAETNSDHELYLMCDDVNATIAALARKGVKCAAIQEQRWGSLTQVPLPGGGTIGMYQPKHALAHDPSKRARAAERRHARTATKRAKRAARATKQQSARPAAKPAAKKGARKASKRVAKKK